MNDGLRFGFAVEIKGVSLSGSDRCFLPTIFSRYAEVVPTYQASQGDAVDIINLELNITWRVVNVASFRRHIKYRQEDSPAT